MSDTTHRPLIDAVEGLLARAQAEPLLLCHCNRCSHREIAVEALSLLRELYLHVKGDFTGIFDLAAADESGPKVTV